ncbi:hypothetical protein TrST_g9293 [Triparma strigata]|uniref:Calmodulin n=1 Tax=Triparma strigata TaxID=1606541 RepID=A0A9W7EXL5_9STRA|nr:hypothetical protein TrST_g9293 [Triparma strigata]
MDPLNESKKLALQSPRGKPGGVTVPPKLFELGTNHSSRPKDHATFRKPGFQVYHGILVDRGNEMSSQRNSPRPAISPRSTGMLPMQIKPYTTQTQWMDKAGQVLRFKAYFQEAVLDSETEAFRVRKVNILFYLSDGTMEVTEPRVQNSGLACGTFLKRAHIPNPKTGEAFNMDDLRVGDNVEIFGRTFHIYDCDEFTRGAMPEQGPADIPPIDTFQMTIDSPSKPKTKSTRSTPRKGHWLKAAATTTADSSELQKSMAMEEPIRILRFFAKWVGQSEDDAPGAEKRKELYKIHFFLEDESLEIVISNKQDLNYQHFPVLLSRQMATTTPKVSVGDIGTDKEYIGLDDLCVGKIVTIQDRQMLIYKADERTYDWMEAVKGIDMRGDEVDIVEKLPEPPKPEVEEGEEEEAEPVDPEPKLSAKEKFYKQAHLAGKILRFSARIPMDLRHPADVDQQFVISYYLADDSISVFCRSPPNSGLTSGQFLNRGFHINTATGKAFTHEEFYLGARLHFRSRVLEIDDVDEYSLAYTHLSINEIMALVRRKVEEKNIDLHKTFLEFDTDHNQVITYDEFCEVLQGSNFNLRDMLAERDLMTLFRQFDTSNDGQISYLEFCHQLQQADPFHSEQDFTGMDPHEVFVGQAMTDDQIQAYVNLTNEKKLSGRKEIQVDEALAKLVQFTHSHRDDSHTSKLFREFDLDHSGTLSLEEFKQVLMDRMHLGAREVSLIADKFFKPGVETIHYDNFLKVYSLYMDAKKKGMFLGNGYKPPSLKATGMKGILFGGA